MDADAESNDPDFLFFGVLPEGATIQESDPGGRWVRFSTLEGREMIRFQAKDAWTFAPPRRHRPTPETEAGVTPDQIVEVKEGRNRAVGAALGDLIRIDLGGVPDMPGWLDYDFSPIQDPVPLIPIRGMARA